MIVYLYFYKEAILLNDAIIYLIMSLISCLKSDCYDIVNNLWSRDLDLEILDLEISLTLTREVPTTYDIGPLRSISSLLIGFDRYHYRVIFQQYL